jgi:hypothetical protein
MLDRSVDETINRDSDPDYQPAIEEPNDPDESDALCYFCGADMEAGEAHDETCRRAPDEAAK